MSKAIPVVYNGNVFSSVWALFKNLGKDKKEYDRFLKWRDKNLLTPGYYSINDYVRQWVNGAADKCFTYHGKQYNSFRDIFSDMNRLDKMVACKSWINYHKNEFKSASMDEKIDAYFQMLSKKSH
jgi:hypothetical protein